MLTITNQIPSTNPDSWYRFKTDEASVLSYIDSNTGVDENSSLVINAITSNVLIPKWYRPVYDFKTQSKDYLGNQLASSEIEMNGDNSLSIGFNDSILGGFNYTELDLQSPPSIDTIIKSIDQGEIRDYLFQLQMSQDVSRGGSILFGYDETDGYLPAIVDIQNGHTDVITPKTYQTIGGNYEVWSMPFNPSKTYQTNDAGVLIYVPALDIRPMQFKFINPITGRDLYSKTVTFSRDSTIPSQFVLSNSIFPKDDVYESPKHKEYEDDQLIGCFGRKGTKYYNLDDLEIIPTFDMVYFIVKVNSISRINTFEYNDRLTQTNTPFMDKLGFRFHIRPFDKTLYVKDVYGDNAIHPIGTISDNNTSIIHIRCWYSAGDSNNSNPKFNYKMNFEISIGFNTPRVITRKYVGDIIDIKYKGGDTIQSIPSFDSYPFYMGLMPRIDSTLETKVYNGKVGQHIDDRYDMNIPLSATIPIIQRRIYIDNIVMYKNLTKEQIDRIRQDFTIGSTPNSNRDVHKNLIQYWPCEQLRPVDLRSTENTISTSTSNTYYDLYGYMKMIGPGIVSVNETELHRVVKGSLKFDGDVMGIANTMATWSNESGGYTINFWFRSEQSSRGTIICDMEKDTANTSGIYIGVARGGLLEIAINSSSSRIYQTNICTGEFRMITIVKDVNRYEYIIYVDSRVIDRIPMGSIIGRRSKSYAQNYQTYFMGHPKGLHTTGSLSRVGFYKVGLSSDDIHRIYSGDIEFRITGTILSFNMPFATPVRFYKALTGELVSEVESSEIDGGFTYRSYGGYDTHMLVTNNNNQFGNIQIIGPLSPTS